MTKHLVRNFFGLLVLYIIIIFGIFAIQFRTELAIFENFFNFELRLTKQSMESESEELLLSNSFNVIGNGFHIFCEDDNPVIAKTDKHNYTPITLQTWEKRSSSCFALNFTNNITLVFDVSESRLSMSLESLNDSDAVRIPYGIESMYSPVELVDNKIIVQSNKNMYSLGANYVSDNILELSKKNQYIASISPYEKNIGFSFSDIAKLDNSFQNDLDTLVRKSRADIIPAFEKASATITDELFVAAYIAEKSLAGDYENAVNTVSAKFIDGDTRTYFTVPYFNNFVAMYETFIDENTSIKNEITKNLANKELSVYLNSKFLNYLQRHTSSSVRDILALPASLSDFSPSVYEAIGILDVYCNVSEFSADLASLLEPVLEQCIGIVETHCVLQDSSLVLMVDDVFVENDFMAKSGKVLQNYGNIKNRDDISISGTMLLLSAIQNIKSADFAKLYAYYVQDNNFYPHGEIIGYNNSNPIWVWGVIPEITVESADDILAFTFQSPIGTVYHSIITGISPFNSVQIRNINKYPSDPQFENYLAPGYVYDKANNTLLLRYVQKSEKEIMRIYYKEIEPEPEIEPEESETEESESNEAESDVVE